MEHPNSDAWLPPGWTVDVRVRKNGKRDKYYFSPSSGLKFNSKVEVFRHLESKVSIQRISDNVIVEKGLAEGLPPGWMKKTRVTTKGETIRRDSYYIDPVSGYVFRSIKDVDRYLESGEIGKNAFKPKDKGSSDKKSAGVTTKPTLSVSLGQSSALDIIAHDQQIPRPASSGENTPIPISEHISSQCAVGTELTSSVLSQAGSSDQKERKVGLTESAIVSGCTDEDAKEKQLQENSGTKHGTEKAQAQNCQRKHKHKKEINLPRRASKRLAGIKVDPLPEIKTRSQARRDAVKQSGEEESPNSLPNGLAKQFNVLDGSQTRCKSDANSTKNTVESPKLGQSMHFYGKWTTPEKHPVKTLEVENHATEKECVRVLENGDKVDTKLDYTLDFPLKELLTDPCIAFAIQTLTGVTFGTSKVSQISSGLKSSQHSEASATAEERGKKINALGVGLEGCNVLSSPENFAIPQEHAGVTQMDDKANENAGSSSGKTPDISWMDPCIEFAIKTLTGTIPLDSDQNPKNCLQQQLSTSNNQHGEMALSSVNLGNLCQSDYYCSQYVGTQKPMFNQSFVDPTLQHTRNIGIGNSAGARLPHRGEDRRNVC